MILSTPITKVKVTLSPKGPQLPIAVTTSGPPRRLTVLAYGSPGSGKTVFASTFPKPLFIDLDDGLMSVREKHVPWIRPTDYSQLTLCTTPEYVTDYDTIVLDTITEAHHVIMAGILKMAGRDQAQQSDWGMARERVIRLVRSLKALEDKHIVLCAEERADKDEETGKIMVGPMLPGQLFTDIGRYVDCVFHLRSALDPTTGKRGRFMLTEPEGLYQGKDRTGKLDKLERPDFNSLWAKISKKEA